MLDTIILQLEGDKFHIMDYKAFNTTEKEVEDSFGFKKWYNNPTKEDKLNDIYKPRITLIKRGLRKNLKVEFSAPKILFNNNVDELKEEDFGDLTKSLRLLLRDMKTLIYTKNLEEAPVLSFHPSKNIELANGFTSNLVIKELKKIDISKRFDMDEKQYRNNGEVLQFYTRSHSFVLYDKIQDLAKPMRRAVDKDQTPTQLNLFTQIKEKNNKFELLRIEVRFGTKRKLNEMLEKVGYTKNPTFKEVFKKDLCQKIVSMYWGEFFKDNLFIFNMNTNPQEILQIVLRKSPNTKIIKAVNIVGLYSLCRDEEGIRGFRQVVENYKPKTNWSTVKKYLKAVDDLMYNNPTWNFIEDIKKELKEFNTFKLKNKLDV